MKTRADFVTNSSSSTSYCIIGVESSAIVKPTVPNGEEQSLFELCDDLKVTYGSIGYEEDCAVLGLSIDAMKEDETMKEFKARALATVLKAFPNSKLTIKNVSVHVDGGYDG